MDNYEKKNGETQRHSWNTSHQMKVLTETYERRKIKESAGTLEDKAQQLQEKENHLNKHEIQQYKKIHSCTPVISEPKSQQKAIIDLKNAI